MTEAQDEALFAIVLEIFQAGVKCGMDDNQVAYPLLQAPMADLTAFLNARVQEAKSLSPIGLRAVVIENGETQIL